MRNKRFNTEAMNTAISDLELVFSNYNVKKDSLLTSYKRYIDNDTHRGDDATASKEYINTVETDFVDMNVAMQNQLLKMYHHSVEAFGEKVDGASNAKLDTETLDTVQSDLSSIYGDLDRYCTDFDNIAADLQSRYGHISYFTKPRTDAARDSLASLCGGNNTESGYINETKHRFLRWDEEECLYVDGLLFDGDIADFKHKLLKSDLLLADVKIADPKVKAVLLNRIVKKSVKKPVVEIPDEEVPKKGGAKKSSSKKDIYKYIQDMYGFSDKDMKYLEKNHPELLWSLYGVRKYSTEDEKKLLKIINRILNMQNATVYGVVETGNYRMSEDNINSNAEYIYYYLRNKGWSKEAICGLLGNIYEESGVNPGIWQFSINGNTGGYGLVQFTAADRKDFYKYMEKQGYTVPNDLNELVKNSPKVAINCQLDYLMQSRSWLYSDAFSQYFDFSQSEYVDCMPDDVQMSFKTFQQSTASPASLALIFHASYERSGDTVEKKDERGASALEWYEYFEEYD